MNDAIGVEVVQSASYLSGIVANGPVIQGTKSVMCVSDVCDMWYVNVWCVNVLRDMRVCGMRYVNVRGVSLP